MPYNNGFVLALMYKGRPAREKKGKVYLPFDSEYSIRVKNKNFQRAIIKIYIDGTPIDSDDEGFILNGYSDIDIERFIEDSLDKGNKFKFVSLENKDVQDPTDSINNGVIEVKVYKEKFPSYTLTYTSFPEVKPWYMYDTWYTYNPYIYKGEDSGNFYANIPSTVTNDVPVGGTSTSCSVNSCSNTNSDCSEIDLNTDSNGATVHGGESNQIFCKSEGFPIEDEPIVLKMKIIGKKFEKNRDTFCTKCGRKRGLKDKFCGTCGTKYNS